jgi:hypothetical protein
MNTDHDPIDEMVAGLRDDMPQMSDRAFAVARTHLLLAVEPAQPAIQPVPGIPAVLQGKPRPLRSPPRRVLRLVASAAAVVALAAGVLVVQTGFDQNTPVASAAATQLNTAADKITPTDAPLKPHQYRYLVSRAWSLAMVMGADQGGETDDLGLTYLAETRSQKWIPADPTRDCTIRGRNGDNVKWLVGNPDKAREMGILEMTKPESFEMTTPCGDFDEGAWQQPSTDFLASLPRDPDALYERLKRDTQGRGQDPDLEILVYATDALTTGVVPADLRAALYRVLAKVPGMEITEKVANLDGQVGTAFGITRVGTRSDVIIDPSTGHYIGQRQVDLDGVTGVPPGTVISYVSVTTPVIVDKLGATG